MRKTPDCYTVRLVRTNDLQSYFTLIRDNSRRMNPFFAETLARTRTRKETLLFIAYNIGQAENRQQFIFVIENHDNGDLVGSLEVRNIDRKGRIAEIGFYIGRDAKATAILTGALGEVTDFCFSFLRLDKLFFWPRIVDKTGRKVAEDSGFTSTGIMMWMHQDNRQSRIRLQQYCLINPINQ